MIWVFVGRTAELARLAEYAREAAAGRPQVVLVEGEAGVGKSALVRQWLAAAGHERPAVMRAFCDAVEQDLAFGVVGQLIAAVPSEVRKDFPLLAGEPSAGSAPFHVGAELLALLGRLQDSGPVVLVVDDVQWVDEASLRALGFVFRRLDADAVLAVLIARRGEPDETGVAEEVRRLVRGHPGACHVRLNGLDAAEVAQLAKGLTGRTVETRVVARLRERTEGNPLYLRALLSDLPNEDTAGGQRVWPVPPSLIQAVQRQLAGLPEQSRYLVEAAAILDGRLPLAVVGRVAGVADAVSALQPGLAGGLLRWWPSDPATPVAIGHALQRDAVIAVMAPSRRQSLHSGAAQVVGGAAAWRHRVAATVGADPRLAKELEGEADRLLASGQVERAATLLLWAADIAGSRIEYERLLLTAAAHLMAADRFAPAKPLIEAVRGCASGPLRDVVLGAWTCCVGDTAVGRPMLTRALEATETRRGEQWIAAIAARWLVTVGVLRGEGELAVSAGRRGLALGGLDRGVADRIKGDLVTGRAMVDGPQAALRELAELAPLPAAERVPEDDAYLLMFRGILRTCAGQPAMAARDLATALPMMNAVMAEFAHNALAADHYFLGQWTDAAVQAERAIVIAEAEDKRWALEAVYATAAWVPAGRGEWRRAQALLSSAEHGADAFPSGWLSTVYLAIGKALLAQARGNRSAMLTVLEGLAHVSHRGHVRLHSPLWQPLYVEGLIGAGRLGDAGPALSALRELAGDMPALGPVTAWLAGQLAEAEGDTGQPAVHYEEGLALPITHDDNPLHRARLEQAYGRLLAHTSDRWQAETWLRRAAERFTALGAQPFLERCNADLETIGTRPSEPRSPSSGADLDVLTDRERDIAHLVSRGLTNNEIAAELFISAKTVEYHLGHVYQKFGFTSRRQLRDRVRGR